MIILLDFSKAFGKVPYRRLLHKLHFYGGRGSILHWIESFLSNRKQRVQLEGVKSKETGVVSRVPKGLSWVLCFSWPILMISQSALPTQKPGCLLMTVSYSASSIVSQNCTVLCICNNTRHRIGTSYTLHQRIRATEDSSKYLGVTVSEILPGKSTLMPLPRMVIALGDSYVETYVDVLPKSRHLPTLLNLCPRWNTHPQPGIPPLQQTLIHWNRCRGRQHSM